MNSLLNQTYLDAIEAFTKSTLSTDQKVHALDILANQYRQERIVAMKFCEALIEEETDVERKTKLRKLFVLLS
jgi:hypothetical protein